MTMSRRSLVAGAALLCLGGVFKGAGAAARPTITVYKDPT